MKKLILALVILCLVVGAIWWLNPSRPTAFRPMPLHETNDIMNTTPYAYLDTVVDVGLAELGVVGLNVLIQPMGERIRTRFEASEGIALEAYIAEWLDGYTICVNGDLGREHAIEVMAHELLHLRQYQQRRLVVGEGTVVTWLGQSYDVASLPYAERPWEQEAFAAQAQLARQMRDTLFAP